MSLQVGVLAPPILTGGSCAVTLRSHQNIIKRSQHAHSTVISHCPTAHILSVFPLLFFFETYDYEAAFTNRPETPSISGRATAGLVQPPANSQILKYSTGGLINYARYELLIGCFLRPTKTVRYGAGADSYCKLHTVAHTHALCS